MAYAYSTLFQRTYASKIQVSSLIMARLFLIPSYMQTEAQLQAICVKWFNEFHRHEGILYHTANERQTSAMQGAKLTALGVVSGVPDLTMVLGGKVYWIELKTVKGTLSPNQIKFHQRLEMQGQTVVVVRTVEEFMAFVKTAG